MWNRAPRTKQFSDANKLPNVSPASYTPYPKIKEKASCVPFNCSAPALALADNGVPAPCTYNIRYRKHRIKGGASLRYTESRNTFSLKSGPSPLSYDPDLLYARKPKYELEGKIYRGKPPRYGFVPSFSIPYKLFDGFDIIKGKGLILRPARLDLRKPIEPMFQHFPYELSKATLKYKGNQWSKLKAKRKFVFSGDPDSPGVGHYDLLDKPPNSWKVFLAKLRSYNVAVADSLRSSDKFINRIILEDQPAPTTYSVNIEPIYGQQTFNIKGTFPKAERFQDQEIITLQQSLNLFPPPTITSTQRFWPPFNSSSEARSKIKVTETSPANYCISNYSIFDNLMRKLKPEEIVAPFDCSSERKFAFGGNENPGPGTYDLLDKPKRVVYGKRDANTYLPPLKLTPLRDREQREVAPWTYNISHGMKSLYNKKDFHKGPIWIKQKRFDRTKWAIKDTPVIVPFGGYNNHWQHVFGERFRCAGDCARRRHQRCSQRRRPPPKDALYMFKDIGALRPGQPIFNKRPITKLEITPGPADYHIHPLYTVGCLKAVMTHNATSDLNRLVWQNGGLSRRGAFRRGQIPER